MIIRLLFCTFLSLFVCTGCGLIYEQNIQQGNAIEQDDLDELYEGMNKRQVLFVLGTASIMDPFHHDRWDYVQTFSRRGSDMIQRTVTLKFENDVLTEIIGRDDTFGASVDETPGDSDEEASFVKKPVSSADPQEESADSSTDEVATFVKQSPGSTEPPEESVDSSTDEVATFVKEPPGSADPQEESIQSATDDLLNTQPDLDVIDERTYEDREYQEDMEVLEQSPDNGPPGPDIDG